MQKNIRKRNLITLGIILMLAVFVPMTANAKNTDAGNGSGSSGSGNGSSAVNSARLQGQNLEKCQNREMAINNVMARIGDRGQKQIKVIESIQQKVQAFYTEKNISVSNYDALVANIADKKQVATTAMNNVRTMNGTFSCSGDNPKGVATQFKSQASIQSGAVAEYRDAVHELAVSIKTALGDSTSATEEN